MMDIGTWAFNNKKLVYFLIAVLMLGGLYEAYKISKLEDPEIKLSRRWLSLFIPERRLIK
jgi:hypothetical protein